MLAVWGVGSGQCHKTYLYSHLSGHPGLLIHVYLTRLTYKDKFLEPNTIDLRQERDGTNMRKNKKSASPFYVYLYALLTQN